MGRPPLNFLETKVRLSFETRERIASLVGNYQISAFIREAVEKELERREAIINKDKISGPEPKD